MQIQTKPADGYTDFPINISKSQPLITITNKVVQQAIQPLHCLIKYLNSYYQS